MKRILLTLALLFGLFAANAGADQQLPVPVPMIAEPTPSGQATGSKSYHLPGGSAASTNATSITGATSAAHTLRMLVLENQNATALAWVRIYDVAGTPTCTSGTVTHNYMVVAGPEGLIVPLPANGEAYANGIGFCITGGSASDTDTTAAPTGITLNADYD